jgi:acetyl esterase
MSGFPHPQMAEILALMQASPAPYPTSLPIAEARHAFMANAAPWNQPVPALDSRAMTIGGVPCQLLVPPEHSAGVVVFVHGGGWTFGTPATHDRFARLLALDAGMAVLLPEYRLAPEHPCPAAIEDVLAVLQALPPALSGPLVLYGDSAGANIALAAALSSDAPDVAMLSLAYGCFAPVFETGSHLSYGDGRFGLSTSRMRWYWSNWQGPHPDARAVPLHADLTGLPPVHLVAAGLDPLCDDSIALSQRLADTGVPLRLDVVPGVVHGFLQMSSKLEPASAARLGDFATAAAAEWAKD